AAERNDVLCHLRNSGGVRSSRAADARVVKDDDVARFREAVCNFGVPVVHVRRKVIKENERRSPRLADTAVGNLNICYPTEFIGSSFVCLFRHVGLTYLRIIGYTKP